MSYIQILGNGMEGDTVPSVLLFFEKDKKRYFFNAGEGLQRFCEEQNIKLCQLDHVFLTRLCLETYGGIAGALLTLAGKSPMNIWSPSDIQHLITAYSLLPIHASMHQYTHSFGLDGKLVNGKDEVLLLEDELVKISVVLLVPYQGQSFKAPDVAATYICEVPSAKGKFDPSKAAALGIRPGPKYGRLQNGCSVFSDDNLNEIFPQDVMEPPSVASTVMLVDCPTLGHIPSLCTASGLQRYYAKDGNVVCVVHLAPTGVVEDPRYQSWMHKFVSMPVHILAGRGCSRLKSPVLEFSARMLTNLHVMCPSVFPITGFNNLNNGHEHQLALATTVAAENMLKFSLRPWSSLGLDASSVPKKLSPNNVEEQLVKEIREITATSKMLKDIWDQGASSEYTKDIPDALRGIGREELEIVFLGTGSSQPSTYRNVSSIYMHFFDKGGMLLDCGEGTYAQLIRRFGIEGVEAILKNMRCVWISHFHADHYGGLARLLSVRRSILAQDSQEEVEPLLVVGPQQLKPLMDAYDKMEALSMEFLDCNQTLILANNAQGRLNVALQALGLQSLVSIPVKHCPQAFGVVLQSQAQVSRPGWKVCFSGDTMPCQQFNLASRGATVFIHEATFDDSKANEAQKKKHSTSEGAIKAGSEEAQAFRTILTHFSQRYPKVPKFDKSFDDKTCVAFDLMSINLADLPILPSLMPALQLLFKDDCTPAPLPNKKRKLD